MENESDENISPPRKFLETTFMQKLCDMCKKSNAYIALNCLFNKPKTQTEIFENLSKLIGIDN